MFARSILLSVVMLLGVLVGASTVLAEPGPAPSPDQSSLAPSLSQLQFGAVDIHFGGSSQQSVTFSNESLSAATIVSTTVSGSEAPHFEVVYDDCVNQTIEPGGKCTIEVRFQPDERGEENATLTVELLGGEGTLEVPLSGEGITGALSASPYSLDFSAIPYTQGEHEENQNETEQINIESHDAGVQIESVSITGSDASSFSVQYGDCEDARLASGNWCDMGIRFQPLSPGPKHAQLVIVSDSQNSPLVVPLEGEGLLGPKISLESNEALLGDVPIGATVSHTFTVANTGDYPLFIQQSFLVSGTPKMFPLLSDTCSGQMVLPDASCEYTIGFAPATPGEKDASLIFITNATPQINVLGIDGIGLLPATAPAPAPVTASASIAPQIGQVVMAPVSRPVSANTPLLLTFAQASHLYSSIGNRAIDTGVDAQCPAKASVCRTDSVITARVVSRRSKTGLQSVGHTTVLLGSGTALLHGGEHISMRIPLSRSAVELLRDRGHLRATIDTIIQSDGKIIAERARVVTLVASEPFARD